MKKIFATITLMLVLSSCEQKKPEKTQAETDTELRTQIEKAAIPLYVHEMTEVEMLAYQVKNARDSASRYDAMKQLWAKEHFNNVGINSPNDTLDRYVGLYIDYIKAKARAKAATEILEADQTRIEELKAKNP